MVHVWCAWCACRGAQQCQPARPRRTSWHGASTSAAAAGGGALFSPRPSPSPSRPGRHRAAASYSTRMRLQPECRRLQPRAQGLQERPAPFSSRPVECADRAVSASRGHSARWEAWVKGLGELNSKASTWPRRVAAWMHGAAAWIQRLQPRHRPSTSKGARSEEGKGTRSDSWGCGGKAGRRREGSGPGRRAHFL